jgi:hypothetical protein
VLASLAVAILVAGLVFGGWILGFGVLITIVTLLGWLNDARKEYRHVVAADLTGHIENEPPPTWPKTVLWVMAIGLVVSVVLTNGWFPPRSSAAPEGGAPGASGAPGGSGGPPASGGAGGDVSVTAENVKFDTTTLAAPADKPFTLAFDNKDAGTPHDVDILDASGKKVFDGKDFPGPKVTVYDVPPLAAGTYKFECSIHPALMNGELTAGG